MNEWDFKLPAEMNYQERKAYEEKRARCLKIANEKEKKTRTWSKTRPQKSIREFKEHFKSFKLKEDEYELPSDGSNS